MTLSGPDALRALDEALRDIRREEDEIAKRAARGAELLIKLFAQEAELYRLLGAIRLDDAARPAQAQLIAEINGTVEATISRYDAAFADAEAGLQHAEADLARGNAERTALQSETTKRDVELTALVAKARPKLGSDAGYTTRLTTAQELAAQAEQSIEKLARAEADREQKGRAFRDDELFMYLWNRGYGTPGYAAKGLAAWLDGKVAAVTGYERTSANFSLLKEIPVKLREHTERLQEAARAAAAEIASIENVAIDTAGGRNAREAIETSTAKIDALDKENVVLQDRRDAAVLARSKLAQGSDPAYASALDDLSAMLERPELRLLLAQARATPMGKDVSVVEQLDDLTQRVKDETEEAREYQTQLKTLASRRRGLEDVQYEIKVRGFDNPHSRFAEDQLVHELLNDFLRGGLTGPAYWERWRQSQSWSTPGYGGPGGGWGRLAAVASGTGLSRPRPSPLRNTLTSAA